MSLEITCKQCTKAKNFYKVCDARTKKEVIQDYIKTRMKIAGVMDDIFTPPAYEAIYSCATFGYNSIMTR